MGISKQKVSSILYVEDEPEARDLMLSLLSEEHPQLRIITAADGAEGLALFKEHQPQLVITDVRMPVMDGLTMAAQIRDIDADVDMIALTAYSDTSFLVRAIELGFSSYVFKPINFNKLLAAIDKAIAVRELKHQVSEQNELLRESEQRLQATFDQAAVGIAHIGLDGRFLRINRRFCDIAGCSGDRHAANIYDFTHPDDLPVCRTNDALLLEGKVRSYSLEKRYLHGDTTVWASLTMSMVYDSTGNAIFMVAIVDDITNRKLLEQELESANRDLRAFNYTVAHDLRQPLNLVSGYCQGIKMACGNMLTADCLEFVDKALDGTLRMNKLVNALLQFAEMAHAELRQETVDLTREAEEIAADLARSDPQRKVKVGIAAGMTAQGDPQLLRVVLTNLIGNAWKYTKDIPAAAIEFGSTMREGTNTFFVRDNGIGFDSADAEQIFLPFRRLPGGKRVSGFGIGLATVERIVKRHGGKIWAEGESGKGATFYFILP